MFCAFAGAPRILRLHGRGEAIEPGDSRFSGLLAHFPELPGVRSVIVVSLERISDSCGYAVPLYSYEHDRGQLSDWVKRKGPGGLARYRADNNRLSIDGLPGFSSPAAAK